MKKDGSDGTCGHDCLFPDDLLKNTKKKGLSEKDMEDGSVSKMISSLLRPTGEGFMRNHSHAHS